GAMALGHRPIGDLLGTVVHPTLTEPPRTRRAVPPWTLPGSSGSPVRRPSSQVTGRVGRASTAADDLGRPTIAGTMQTPELPHGGQKHFRRPGSPKFCRFPGEPPGRPGRVDH